MKYFFNIIIGFLSTFSFAHGGHMATEHFLISKNKIILELKINTHTLDHFKHELFGSDFNSKKGIKVCDYINKNQKLTINEKKIVFSLISTDVNNETLIIKMESNFSEKKSNNLKLQSNLFYEVDKGFENRVILSVLTSQNKSYRFTKEKNTLNTNFHIK